jgi:transposase-like protein
MDSTSQPGTDRRIRRSREEWEVLVTRYEESGQTPERFCAEMGIGQSTLRRWCSRLRERSPAPGSRSPVFVELPSEQKQPGSTAQPWEVEVQLGAEVVLRLRRTPC